MGTTDQSDSHPVSEIHGWCWKPGQVMWLESRMIQEEMEHEIRCKVCHCGAVHSAAPAGAGPWGPACAGTAIQGANSACYRVQGTIPEENPSEAGRTRPADLGP